MDSNYFKLYAEFLYSHLTLHKSISIVCDNSNGTTGLVLAELSKILDSVDSDKNQTTSRNNSAPKLSLLSINADPNPEFPAHGPNPLIEGATNEASGAVKDIHADIGVIFDADGDRAFFVDEQGTLLPSFVVSSLIFKNLPPPYIADELVYQSLRHMKLFKEEDLLPTRVGSYFVKKMLRERGATAAGEFSGHYYYKEFFGADSGLFSMITMVNLLSANKRPLSEEVATLPPQVVMNEDVQRNGREWSEIQSIIEKAFTTSDAEVSHRDGITIVLNNAWICIRPSNTEPLVRLTAGGIHHNAVQDLINKVKSLL